ncbi:MAG: diacylglycerol kinase [Clostridia bacterium]|nr:diacylglycerol kinase [Clostridia bacterium]
MKLENEKCQNAVICALSGLVKAIKTEQNLKIDILVAVVIIVCGFVFKINNYEWIACIFSIGIMLFAELMNTAIETVVDMYTREKNEMAKRAKDISASAVLVLALNIAIVGGIIFIPKVFSLLIK